MTAPSPWPRWSPWLALFAAWTLALSLAGRLLAAAPAAAGHDSLARLFFRSTSGAISQRLYREADKSFHRGIAYFRSPSFAQDPFRRLLDEVSPEAHRHVEGKAVREIMPWLWATLRFDPHCVEAYQVAAFWLAISRHFTEAEQVLQEARRNNPDDYRVPLERGRLCLRLGQPDKARLSFDAALRLWPSRLDPADEQVRLDRAQMLTYRALVHELHGETETAAQRLEQALQIFPDRRVLRDRIADLRAGRPTMISASQMWAAMLEEKPDHMVAGGSGPKGHDGEGAHAHAHDAPGGDPAHPAP